MSITSLYRARRAREHPVHFSKSPRTRQRRRFQLDDSVTQTKECPSSHCPEVISRCSTLRCLSYECPEQQHSRQSLQSLIRPEIEKRTAFFYLPLGGAGERWWIAQRKEGFQTEGLLADSTHTSWEARRWRAPRVGAQTRARVCLCVCRRVHGYPEPPINFRANYPSGSRGKQWTWRRARGWLITDGKRNPPMKIFSGALPWRARTSAPFVLVFRSPMVVTTATAKGKGAAVRLAFVFRRVLESITEHV